MKPEYFQTRFRAKMRGINWPEQFAIVTAYPTTGEQWSAERITEANERLQAELQRCHVWLPRITGYSPTTGHAEPGWAVPVGFTEACEIGLRFAQDAIYVVQGDELFVSYCDARRELISVGSFRARLDDATPSEHLRVEA